MKTLNRILIPLFCITLLVTGCKEDFLERPSLSDVSAENFYQTPEELRLATAALYAGSPWGEWTYACYFPIGDVLSGNMVLGYNGDAVQFNNFAVTEANGGLTSNWKSMYKVVAHCNTTINNINAKAPASIPEATKNAAIAEARFIRAFAYYNLAMLWKDVPIIEDNTILISSPLVRRNNVDDVYQFIVNDLTFAAQYLPAVDKGRVTTWSAQGMLAKVYLTWAGLKSPGTGDRDPALLDLARQYAGNVCNNKSLKLLGFEDDGTIDLSGYPNLFKVQYNDNVESLFSLQWHPSPQGWLGGNMLQLYSSGGDKISASGVAGWFGISPTYDMFLQYAENDVIRRKATFMLKGDEYPELDAAGGGFTYAGDAGLKKHIIGTRLDNSSPTMTEISSPEHNALLRLADVYLLYAEAIIGNNDSTQNAEAIKYYNKVRKRAGVDTLGLTEEGEQKYLTADMVFKERRIELAAESQFWFDIVRLYYYDNEKAIKFLNDQKADRVPFTYNKDTGVAEKRDPFGEITDASAGTFRFPLPPSEVTANPQLTEPPVPYSFND
jgi:starch-binding outer membrane protein, SusD/RagB family